MAPLMAPPDAAAPGGPTWPPGEDRGSISISERAVEKLAAHAIGEVDQVGGAAFRLLGVPTRREDPDRAPQVRATVRGRVCLLQVRLSVCYPASVTRVTDLVRAHLIDRLGELTGLDVREVDITVIALHHPHPHGRVIE